MLKDICIFYFGEGVITYNMKKERTFYENKRQ